MELHLQFGYGMMEHCRTLVSKWQGATVILSPRDLTDGQLARLAGEIGDSPGGRVLMDPQFYLPHADHRRLCTHGYWPQDYETGKFWEGPDLVALLSKLNELNARLNTDGFLLPGLLSPKALSEDWLATQQAVLEEAKALNCGRPLIATVALSSELLTRDDQIPVLLERSEHWRPSAFYLVCEHPKGQYLVDDPNWLANVIDLAAGLRLNGAKVIVGYCNHQMLIASLAKVNAIASGTWMNVRSFPPEKFKSEYEQDLKQRATWYYAPHSLSEYKVPFLDVAWRHDMLGRLAPPENLDGGYARALFSGGQPSSVGFTEQMAFRHYLHCLRGQVLAAEKPTFDETVAAHRDLLDVAKHLLSILSGKAISGQQRDFSDVIQVNRAALELFVSLRGPLLRKQWASI